MPAQEKRPASTLPARALVLGLLGLGIAGFGWWRVAQISQTPAQIDSWDMAADLHACVKIEQLEQRDDAVHVQVRNGCEHAINLRKLVIHTHAAARELALVAEPTPTSISPGSTAELLARTDVGATSSGHWLVELVLDEQLLCFATPGFESSRPCARLDLSVID